MDKNIVAWLFWITAYNSLLLRAQAVTNTSGDEASRLLYRRSRVTSFQSTIEQTVHRS